MPQPFPTRREIASRQLERINRLCETIREKNRFYAAKLSSSPGSFPSIESFIEAIPFTTKMELAADQASSPPYGTNLTFPLDHYTRCHQTSGTAGTPLRWLDRIEDWDWMVANWQRILTAAGVTTADRVFFAFSFGPFIGFWLAFDASTRIGCLCLPGGGMSTATRLRQILAHAATVLCCTPTYALHLADSAGKEGIDLSTSAVKRIVVAGEPGGSVPATRDRIENLWRGARVFDHHGMTELGAVSFECPERPCVLHIMEDAYLPEVIDPSSGVAVNPGEQGELVLTSLGRFGSPLLRYRTGDLVKSSAEPCACGRADLALAGGILGRTDDMVVVRGVNVYPSAIDEIIRRAGDVAEYRVHILKKGALTELELEIEPDPSVASKGSIAQKLERALHDALALRIGVRLTSSLPRFEMKARRWIREGE